MSNHQKGNAFVYVLVAVVLFAALSFILIRQEDSKETGTLTPDQARLLASQLIGTSTQIKSALDQMIFAGTDPSEFNYNPPSSFGAAPHFDKVFHPEGGGVTLPVLSRNAVMDGIGTDPESGWYLGSFNNVEWTETTAQEVILTAYGIEEIVCQELNRIITGATDIPTLDNEIRRFLIDDNEHSSSNINLNIANCTDCESLFSICVQNSTQDEYAFYNILIAR